MYIFFSALKTAKAAFKAWIKAQTDAMIAIGRWGEHESNQGLQDILTKLIELNKIWSDIQMNFADQIKEFRKIFEAILATECTVDTVRKHKVFEKIFSVK